MCEVLSLGLQICNAQRRAVTRRDDAVAIDDDGEIANDIGSRIGQTIQRRDLFYGTNKPAC